MFKYIKKKFNSKTLNHLAIIKNFSLIKTEIIPKIDMIFVYLFYRFNIFRNAFLRKKSSSFHPKIKTQSKNFDFDFNETTLTNLDQDGITPVFHLSNEALSLILNSLNDNPLSLSGKHVKIPATQMFEYGKSKKLDGLVHYKDLNKNQALVSLGSDPALLQFMSSYLRSDNMTLDITAFWSYPNLEPIGNQSDGKYDNAQNFHFDHAARRCVKLFCYLTDCMITNGPHCYIKKSHIKRPLKLQFGGWSLRDYEIEEFHKKDDSWLFLTGKAGTAFITDPFGAHRGLEPVDGCRLLIQFMYSVDRFRQANYEININSTETLSDSLIEL